MPWTTKMQQFIIQHDSDWKFCTRSSDSAVHIILFECAHHSCTHTSQPQPATGNIECSVIVRVALRHSFGWARVLSVAVSLSISHSSSIFLSHSVAPYPIQMHSVCLVVCFVRSFVLSEHWCLLLLPLFVCIGVDACAFRFGFVLLWTEKKKTKTDCK